MQTPNLRLGLRRTRGFILSRRLQDTEVRSPIQHHWRRFPYNSLTVNEADRATPTYPPADSSFSPLPFPAVEVILVLAAVLEAAGGGVVALELNKVNDGADEEEKNIHGVEGGVKVKVQAARVAHRVGHRRSHPGIFLGDSEVILNGETSRTITNPPGYIASCSALPLIFLQAFGTAATAVTFALHRFVQVGNFHYRGHQSSQRRFRIRCN